MAHTDIGVTQHGRALSLSMLDRMQHMALFGATGVGKSTLILNLFAQDVMRGDGVFLLDPNGDLAERALTLVPPHRANHVCYLNFTDLGFPIGINPLQDVEPDRRALMVDAFVAAARGIWIDTWGARLEEILRHSCMALVERPNASLFLMPRFLSDDTFRDQVVARVSHVGTRAFFGQRFAKWRDAYREEAIDPVLNKIDALLFSPSLQNTLSQARSALSFEYAMDRGRIVICNLAKGLVGETNAYLMGALLLSQIEVAAMSRAAVAPNLRRPFFVHVDEAQNFGGQSIARFLSEVRKYRVGVTIATQFIDGLNDRVRAAVFGNVGTLVTFRVGVEDAEVLAPEYARAHQAFNPWALHQLEIGTAMVRLPAQDGALAHLPPEPPACGDATHVINQSRRHYGTPRNEVEENLLKLLARSKPI